MLFVGYVKKMKLNRKFQIFFTICLFTVEAFAQNLPPPVEPLSIEDAVTYLKENKINFQASEELDYIEILPDPTSQNKFVRNIVNKAHEMQHKVYFVTVSSGRMRKGSDANVNFKTQVMNLQLRNLVKLDNPVVAGNIQHELRHIIESQRHSEASRLSLKVIEPTIKDAVYGYGIRNNYRLDEASAFYQGGAITYALSNKRDKGNFEFGKDLTFRQLEILKEAQFIQENFQYDIITGIGTLQITTPPELKKFMGSEVTAGRFVLNIQLEANLSNENALKESQVIFDRYYEKLIRVGNSYQKILIPNTPQVPCDDMFTRLKN